MKQSLLIIFAFIGLLSCKKQLLDVEVKENPTSQEQSFRSSLIQYSDFIQYGELHNAHLTNAHNNFRGDEVSSLEAGIDHVASFTKNYTNSLNISNSEKLAYNEATEEYKDFSVAHNIMNDEIFGANGTIYLKINELYSLGGINNFEKETLIDFANKTIDSYNGIISQSDYKNFVLSIKNEW